MGARALLPLAAWAALGVVGCRGDLSPNPPLHANQNMDDQKYIQAQEPQAFWKDGRGMRPQVAGTIARGELRDNRRFHEGKRLGKWTRRLPIKLSREALDRGKARFEIYCAVCHGHTGDGKHAVMAKKNMAVPAPSYLEERLRAMAVGEIYSVVKHGVRNMPAYGDRVPPTDRWAITAYVRALQVAGTAKLERVPRAIAEQKGWNRK